MLAMRVVLFTMSVLIYGRFILEIPNGSPQNLTKD